MDVTNTALNSTRTGNTLNLRSSSSNSLNSDRPRPINASVSNLAQAIGGALRIVDNNQPFVQNQSRNLRACSETVANAIEVLIGSDLTASPHSMVLSPTEINSTVKAFSRYLGHAPALSLLHLAMEQPNGAHGLPSVAELQNSLTCLGNNSPDRAQDIARASLYALVKNIPEGAVGSPVPADLARQQGPVALLFLTVLAENPAEEDAINTRTNLSVGELTQLHRMLGSCVNTLHMGTTQSVNAQRYTEHIAVKLILFYQLRTHDPRGFNAETRLTFSEIADTDTMSALVIDNGLFLNAVIDELRSDEGMVMAAVQQNGVALQYASPELRGNRNVVMAAVQQHGLAIRHADLAFRNDSDVMLAAVRQDGIALGSASRVLLNDLDLVRAAVQQNQLAIHFVASPALRAMI